jgi:hypothetical protein
MLFSDAALHYIDHLRHERLLRVVAQRRRALARRARLPLIPRDKGNKSRLLHPSPECLNAPAGWLRIRPEADHDWSWPHNKARRLS